LDRGHDAPCRRHARLGEPASPAEHEALVEEQAELDEAVVRLGGWERGA